MIYVQISFKTKQKNKTLSLFIPHSTSQDLQQTCIENVVVATLVPFLKGLFWCFTIKSHAIDFFVDPFNQLRNLPSVAYYDLFLIPKSLTSA